MEFCAAKTTESERAVCTMRSGSAAGQSLSELKFEKTNYTASPWSELSRTSWSAVTLRDCVRCLNAPSGDEHDFPGSAGLEDFPVGARSFSEGQSEERRVGKECRCGR